MPRIRSDSLYNREKAGCWRCLVPGPKEKKNSTGRSKEAAIIRIGGIAEMWCARWMRSAFVIPVGDSVTSRSSFSDESSIIGKYDKRAAPPTKGIGTVKNLAELTLQIRTYLRNRRAQWGKRGECPPEGKKPEEKGRRRPFSNMWLSFRTCDATGHLLNRCTPLNRLRTPLEREIDFNVLLFKRRDVT